MKQQQGMVLIGALVVLLIISMMAVGLGLFTVASQQQATANTDALHSYTAADEAMRYAEYQMNNNTDKLTVGASAAIVTAQLSDNWWFSDENWNVPEGCTSCAVKTLPSGDNLSKYRIEWIKKKKFNMKATEQLGFYYLRTVTKGHGDGTAETMMMSYYGLLE